MKEENMKNTEKQYYKLFKDFAEIINLIGLNHHLWWW